MPKVNLINNKLTNWLTKSLTADDTDRSHKPSFRFTKAGLTSISYQMVRIYLKSTLYMFNLSETVRVTIFRIVWSYKLLKQKYSVINGRTMKATTRVPQIVCHWQSLICCCTYCCFATITIWSACYFLFLFFLFFFFFWGGFHETIEISLNYLKTVIVVCFYVLLSVHNLDAL